MSELYSILRKADSRPLPPRFERVQVDSDGRPVASGVLSSMWGGVRGDQVWLVQPDTPCKLDRRFIELSETAFEDTAQITVMLEVEIPRGTYREATGKLTFEQDPVLNVFDSYCREVRQWFRKETMHAPGLHALERAARNRRRLEELATEVGKCLFIHLTAQLGFEPDAFDPLADEPLLKDLQIAIPEFTISLSDRLAHQVLLALDFSLRRNGTVQIQPPADDDAWRNRVRDWVQQEARRTISANDYYGDPEYLAKQIAGIIDSTMKPFGRAVRHIDARAKTRLPVPPAQTLDLEVDWLGRPSGHRTTFKISATMKVDPAQHQIFIARGAPSYEQWLSEHAKMALETELVAADFVDLTPDYVDELQLKLKKALRAAAQHDGMLIEPFIATPQVPDIVRTRIVRFTTDKQKYQTRDGSFDVWLDISVEGSFKNLRHVTSLLQTTDELVKRMKEITVGAAAQVLRGAYADRYVLRFDQSINLEGQKVPPEGVEGIDGQSPSYLADIIRNRIKSELERNLCLYCDLDNIQLVQQDDKVAELIHMILELRSFVIEVDVEPFDKTGKANWLPVKVTYQVQAVNPASTLVVLRQEYPKEQLQEDIKSQIQIWTKDVLSALQSSQLRTKDINRKWGLRDCIDEKVRTESRRFFGTEVTVLAIEVGPSLAEALALDQAALIHQLDAADLKYQQDHIHDPDYREEQRKKLAAAPSLPTQPGIDNVRLGGPSTIEGSTTSDYSREDGGLL